MVVYNCRQYRCVRLKACNQPTCVIPACRGRKVPVLVASSGVPLLGNKCVAMQLATSVCSSWPTGTWTHGHQIVDSSQRPNLYAAHLHVAVTSTKLRLRTSMGGYRLATSPLVV